MGVCSRPRDMASETTASRNSQEPPHPVLWQEGPCSYDRPEGPRRNIPTPAETRTKPLPVVTERSYKGPGRIWACKKAVPCSALPVLFLRAHDGRYRHCMVWAATSGTSPLPCRAGPTQPCFQMPVGAGYASQAGESSDPGGAITPVLDARGFR